MKKHPRLGSRFWTILLIDRTAIQRVGLDSVNATDGLGLYRVSALPLGENGWCQMFQPCMLLCNCRRIQLNIIYFVSYVARHVCINTIEQRRDKNNIIPWNLPLPCFVKIKHQPSQIFLVTRQPAKIGPLLGAPNLQTSLHLGTCWAAVDLICFDNAK